MIRSHPLNTDRQTAMQHSPELDAKQAVRTHNQAKTGSQERKRIDLVSVLQDLLLSRHHRHYQRIWEEEAAEPKLLLYNPTSGYLGDQGHQAPSGVTGFLRGGRERRTRGNHLLHCCRGRRASERKRCCHYNRRWLARNRGIPDACPSSAKL